jgi:hypothetical protein
LPLVTQHHKLYNAYQEKKLRRPKIIGVPK